MCGVGGAGLAISVGSYLKLRLMVLDSLYDWTGRIWCISPSSECCRSVVKVGVRARGGIGMRSRTRLVLYGAPRPILDCLV